jgi:hypothetical protein
VTTTGALQREILELKTEVRRLRDIKDEALEQAQQWERAFIAEREHTMELERQLHGGKAA